MADSTTDTDVSNDRIDTAAPRVLTAALYDTARSQRDSAFALGQRPTDAAIQARRVGPTSPIMWGRAPVMAPDTAQRAVEARKAAERTEADAVIADRSFRAASRSRQNANSGLRSTVADHPTLSWALYSRYGLEPIATATARQSTASAAAVTSFSAYTTVAPTPGLEGFRTVTLATTVTPAADGAVERNPALTRRSWHIGTLNGTTGIVDAATNSLAFECDSLDEAEPHLATLVHDEMALILRSAALTHATDHNAGPLAHAIATSANTALNDGLRLTSVSDFDGWSPPTLSLTTVGVYRTRDTTTDYRRHDSAQWAAIAAPVVEHAAEAAASATGDDGVSRPVATRDEVADELRANAWERTQNLRDHLLASIDRAAIAATVGDNRRFDDDTAAHPPGEIPPSAVLRPIVVWRTPTNDRNLMTTRFGEAEYWVQTSPDAAPKVRYFEGPIPWENSGAPVPNPVEIPNATSLEALTAHIAADQLSRWGIPADRSEGTDPTAWRLGYAGTGSAPAIRYASSPDGAVYTADRRAAWAELAPAGTPAEAADALVQAHAARTLAPVHTAVTAYFQNTLGARTPIELTGAAATPEVLNYLQAIDAAPAIARPDERVTAIRAGDATAIQRALSLLRARSATAPVTTDAADAHPLLRALADVTSPNAQRRDRQNNDFADLGLEPYVISAGPVPNQSGQLVGLTLTLARDSDTPKIVVDADVVDARRAVLDFHNNTHDPDTGAPLTLIAPTAGEAMTLDAFRAALGDHIEALRRPDAGADDWRTFAKAVQQDWHDLDHDTLIRTGDAAAQISGRTDDTLDEMDPTGTHIRNAGFLNTSAGVQYVGGAANAPSHLDHDIGRHAAWYMQRNARKAQRAVAEQLLAAHAARHPDTLPHDPFTVRGLSLKESQRRYTKDMGAWEAIRPFMLVPGFTPLADITDPGNSLTSPAREAALRQAMLAQLDTPEGLDRVYDYARRTYVCDDHDLERAWIATARKAISLKQGIPLPLPEPDHAQPDAYAPRLPLAAGKGLLSDIAPLPLAPLVQVLTTAEAARRHPDSTTHTIAWPVPGAPAWTDKADAAVRLSPERERAAAGLPLQLRSDVHDLWTQLTTIHTTRRTLGKPWSDTDTVQRWAAIAAPWLAPETHRKIAKHFNAAATTAAAAHYTAALNTAARTREGRAHLLQHADGVLVHDDPALVEAYAATATRVRAQAINAPAPGTAFDPERATLYYQRQMFEKLNDPDWRRVILAASGHVLVSDDRNLVRAMRRTIDAALDIERGITPTPRTTLTLRDDDGILSNFVTDRDALPQERYDAVRAHLAAAEAENPSLRPQIAAMAAHDIEHRDAAVAAALRDAAINAAARELADDQERMKTAPPVLPVITTADIRLALGQPAQRYTVSVPGDFHSYSALPMTEAALTPENGPIPSGHRPVGTTPRTILAAAASSSAIFQTIHLRPGASAQFEPAAGTLSSAIAPSLTPLRDTALAV